MVSRLLMDGERLRREEGVVGLLQIEGGKLYPEKASYLPLPHPGPADEYNGEGEEAMLEGDVGAVLLE